MQHLLQVVNNHIEESKAALALLRESRDTESKSSAGDKYETGRAMAQIELDKIQQHLQNQIRIQAELLKIAPETCSEKAGFGSLVNTTAGNYFISVGMGKIAIDNEEVYAVSLASPIGQALKEKKSGDSMSFNGNTIQIINIV